MKSPSLALSSSMEEPRSDFVVRKGTPMAPARSRSGMVSIDQFWTSSLPSRTAREIKGCGVGKG